MPQTIDARRVSQSDEYTVYKFFNLLGMHHSLCTSLMHELTQSVIMKTSYSVIVTSSSAPIEAYYMD